MAQPLAPKKNSKHSLRRKNRGFVSLEVSSRKHRRARSRLYLNPDADHRHKGRIDYHS